MAQGAIPTASPLFSSDDAQLGPALRIADCSFTEAGRLEDGLRRSLLSVSCMDSILNTEMKLMKATDASPTEDNPLPIREDYLPVEGGFWLSAVVLVTCLHTWLFISAHLKAWNVLTFPSAFSPISGHVSTGLAAGDDSCVQSGLSSGMLSVLVCPYTMNGS